MTTQLTSYVSGSWQAGSAEGSALYNPTTEAVIGHCDTTGIDFQKVVSHGRDVGGPALREVGFAKRAEWLKAVSAAIHERREELIAASHINGGCTRGDAKFDIDGCTATLAAYAYLGKSLGDDGFLPDGDGQKLGRTGRFWGQHVRVPRPGVAVHINAFNFPAWGMGEKLAQAILAGVPVITKPGTPTALVAWKVAQAIVDCGALPEGAFQFIAGRTGDMLDLLGPQDCMSFTGSASTGARLKANASFVGANARCTLEADSLNAAVMGPDLSADDEAYNLFLSNVATDMTQKTGQKCTAVRRILVPESQVEAVAAELAARLSAVAIGDPSDENTRMGPVASAQQFEDVRDGITALGGVGKIVCGGAERVREQGFFFAPTLVVANDVDADLIHEREVFGPCATILPYSGDAARAVELVNRGGGGLVASLYSNDKRWTEEVVMGISPWHGRIWIGSDKVADQAGTPGTVLPFSIHGGPGRAGGGEELGGLRGLEFYTQRTALQGDQGFVGRRFGPTKSES